MHIEIPDPSLVVLVGAAGSGKTTFARKHFAPAEVVSSDAFRALVANDEADQKATRDAFEVLHLVAAKRLGRKLLTVIDSTNVYASARAPLLELARAHEVPAVAIVFFLSARISEARRGADSERPVNEWVIRRQKGALNKTLDALAGEGFARVHVLRTLEDVDAAAVARVQWTAASDALLQHPSPPSTAHDAAAGAPTRDAGVVHRAPVPPRAKRPRSDA